MQKKLILIANRTSGAGRAIELIRQAKSALWGWQCDFSLPTSREEYLSICESLDPSKYEATIILGGDGTVNPVLSILAEKKIPLYPFPTGTANDLAGELGLKADWEQVQKLIDEKRVDQIDLITVNGFAFSTVAGMGVGALVTQQFNEWRAKSKIFKMSSAPLKEHIYAAFSLKNIFQKRRITHRIRIESNNFNRVVETASVMVCNQKSLGGSMKVAPEAENTDGMLNVLILRECERMDLIRALLNLRRGIWPVGAVTFSAPKMRIRELDRRPIQIFGDGEILTSGHDLDFSVLPHALSVYRESA